MVCKGNAEDKLPRTPMGTNVRVAQKGPYALFGVLGLVPNDPLC